MGGKRGTNVNFQQFKTFGVQSLYGICITAPTRRSSGITATGMTTNSLLTAEEQQGGRDRSWALLCCTQAASPSQPCGDKGARGLQGAPLHSSTHPTASGALSLWNGGAQGLPLCLCTQVHTATAPSRTAHASGWSAELGVPWAPHCFWWKRKRNSSRQTLSFYSAHPGYLTLPWKRFGSLCYWYLNRTPDSKLLVEVH